MVENDRVLEMLGEWNHLPRDGNVLARGEATRQYRRLYLCS